jgi:hypothetical protein
MVYVPSYDPLTVYQPYSGVAELCGKLGDGMRKAA